MPTFSSPMVLSLLVLFLVVCLLHCLGPETEVNRARDRRARDREARVRTMLNKAYHCVMRALVTNCHLREKQRENLEILATIGEVEIADPDTTWRLGQGERQTPGINTTNDELTLQMARQVAFEILSSYTQLEKLLDGAVEKLREIQDDLNWFLMIEGTDIKLPQTGRSKRMNVREAIDRGRYAVDIDDALATIQLAVDGLWQ